VRWAGDAGSVKWATFRSVVLPLLGPSQTLFLVVWSTINALQLFDEIYVTTVWGWHRQDPVSARRGSASSEPSDSLGEAQTAAHTRVAAALVGLGARVRIAAYTRSSTADQRTVTGP
jgi:multiple sugar transport system permease protein